MRAHIILLGECIAFLASGSDPTISIRYIRVCSIYWRVAGSSLSYLHTTYPDLLIFSMHENNRTESIITERGK